MLEGVPLQVLQHVSDATGTFVVILDKPGSPPLDHLQLVDLVFRMRGPDSRGVFQGRANIRLEGSRFDLWRTRSDISTDEGHGGVCFLCDITEMLFPGEIV